MGIRVGQGSGWDNNGDNDNAKDKGDNKSGEQSCYCLVWECWKFNINNQGPWGMTITGSKASGP